MGLFDNYQFQGYGGQGGGLLDVLQMMQSVPMQQPQGFPAPPQQEPAALPAQAQPAQAPTPPQMQQPQMGLGDRLSAGFQGFANAGSPMQALGNLVGGLATGQRTDPVGIYQQQANQTERALVSYGFNPGLAKVISGNPDLMKAVLPHVMGIGGQTDDIKEYQFAKKEDPSLTFDKFMARKRAVSGEYGLTPIWGTDANGNPGFIQPGKSGKSVQAELPAGFKIARDPIKVEGPTGTVILDPQTRQQVGFIPKDVAGAAKEKEIGEATGQAIVNLPTVIATAENTLKTIKQLEEHPGKKNWGAFGLGAMLPDMPGGETRGFGALVDQVKGQNFMTAFQSIKGAGAITEQEGAKAERAQARLERAQSEKDFDIAIKDLKEVVTAGLERARQKAGVKHNQDSPTAGPSIDDLVKKYK